MIRRLLARLAARAERGLDTARNVGPIPGYRQVGRP